MLGRTAYQHPYRLAEIDSALFGGEPPSRHTVVAAMMPYAEAQMRQGVPLKSITRHMLGLFQGLPGARKWRRMLSEEAHRADAEPELLLRAADSVARAELERAA
jgi:tRNA-dihydrouridine synthase A